MGNIFLYQVKFIYNITCKNKKIESKEIIIEEEKKNTGKKYWKTGIKFAEARNQYFGILPVPHIVSV